MHWKLKVKPDRIIACYSGKSKRSLMHWRKAPKRTAHNGKLSDNAKRKLKQSIRWLIACSETKQCYEKKHAKLVDWKINLATFTFKKNLQDDNVARKIFSMWLEMAKYRFDIKQYVWKAEPQERGAIHFHAAFNKYIPHEELNYTWNRLCYKQGLPQPRANSTDIHAVIHAMNLESYLTDYMLNEEKHEGRRPINGRLWGCSHGISNAGKSYMLIDKDELITISNELENFSLEKILKSKGKELPKGLQHIGYWVLPTNYFSNLQQCAVKEMWYEEISKLVNKSQLEFWQREIV